MSVYTKNNTAYGLSQGLVGVMGGPIVAQRAPTTTDKAPIGMMWVDQVGDDYYILTSIIKNVANWVGTSGGSTIFADVTTTGVGGVTAQLGNITATAGDLISVGGAVTAGVGNITATLGNIIAAAGNIEATAGSLEAGTTVTAGTGITATTGNITATVGDVIVTAGNLTVAAGNIDATVGTISAGANITAGTDLLASNGAIFGGNTAVGTGGSALILFKNRAGGIVTLGDTLGSILFEGHDGVGYQVGAQITSVNTDAVGVGLIPANLRFWTKPNGAGILASRLEINSNGEVTINAPTAGVGLTVAAGGITVTAGNITATAGDVIATAGDIVATAGAIDAGTTVTAGTGITATTGDITATTGDIVATAGDIETTAGAITSATSLTATLGDITATNGNVVFSTAATGITLPGPIRIISGAGAPAAGLALHVGDLYIRTDPGNANERMYVATVVATTWTNVTCAA